MEHLKDLAKKLIKKRETLTGHVYVDQALIHAFIHNTSQILNPHVHPNQKDDVDDLSLRLNRAELDLYEILRFVLPNGDALKTAKNFFSNLSDISDLLDLDAQSIFSGDPAAKSVGEVIFSYPGYFSITVHRMAHQLWLDKVPLLPRIFSEYAHQLTGIDIHPGATIGRHFYIDHGTGIVIGETALIGDHVKIYQGVTLGALSVDKSASQTKRHPTIEDHSIIYSNATILGGDTVIGHHSVIGGNVWLTKSVPPHSVVYHQSEIKINSNPNP